MCGGDAKLRETEVMEDRQGSQAGGVRGHEQRCAGSYISVH